MNWWRTPSDACHRGQQPELLDVLPRAHAGALGPLRLERRVDRQRHVEVLGGGEQQVVVGVAERPPVVVERGDVAALGALADGPLELPAAAAASLSDRWAVGTSRGSSAQNSQIQRL